MGRSKLKLEDTHPWRRKTIQSPESEHVPSASPRSSPRITAATLQTLWLLLSSLVHLTLRRLSRCPATAVHRRADDRSAIYWVWRDQFTALKLILPAWWSVPLWPSARFPVISSLRPFGIIAIVAGGAAERHLRHTRVGGKCRCRPGRRRRRHVADAPPLTRVFSAWGQTIDAGEPAGAMLIRRPHGRRSSRCPLTTGAHFLIESRPVGGDPRSAISYARVWALLAGTSPRISRACERSGSRRH